ncbi:MAG: hypothetical protein HYT94_00410 [Parcubacteria group bacterium]|nr:hypothetical protein [Parcubacteria group bacterium]
MSNNKNKTIFAAIAVLGIFFSGHLFQNETQAQEDILVSPEAVPSEEAGGAQTEAGGEMLTLLSDMRTIQLDDSLFVSPMFQELQDFSIELYPEPKGRPNPFAPLGKDAVIEEDLSGFATTAPRAISFMSTTE